MRQKRGFTLIELMIVLGIIAILASIAIPSYNEYVRRSQLTEATNNLAAFRVKMEQYYQDNRTYLNGAACGATTPSATEAKYFTYSCAGTASTYTMTATGSSPSTTGFTYTVNEQNVHATTASAWGATSTTVWLDKKP